LIFLFFPFRGVFYFDPDEGINLAKAQLLLRGYSLYDQIWSDQPPILTHLLSFVLRLFGLKVNVARVFILLLICAMIWAIFRFIQSVWGDYHAVVSLFLLILLPKFLELSVSVMVGMPAIVFATISLFFLVQWHQHRKHYYLILSACFLAVSVMTKLFTGILVPIFLIGILIGEYARRQEQQEWQKILAPPLIWSVSFGIVLMTLVLVLVKPNNIQQLIKVHLLSRSVSEFTSDNSLTLAWHLKSAIPILILAMLGLYYSLRSKRWLYLYPAAWMVVASLLLLNHSPVWYHQQMLVTIPAAILAAPVIGEAVQDLKFMTRHGFHGFHSLVNLVCLAAIITLLFTRVPPVIEQFNATPSLLSPGLKDTTEQAQILKKMTFYASRTNWVITDKPIYAFWARLPVPPELLVFTNKRIITGELSDVQVLSFFQSYRPEQVLFTQYSDPLISNYLTDNYQLVFSRFSDRLYIRNDILSSQVP